MVNRSSEERKSSLLSLLSSRQKFGVVGLAKNAGKTTTFNWLVKEAVMEKRRIALASIGVDGEKYDVWDHHDKPNIPIAPGTIVATGKGLLHASTAKFKVIEEIKPTSPVGPVYLLECIQEGNVILGGTQQIEDLKKLYSLSGGLGIDHYLIDGAYDRMSSVQASVIDAFMLCTGAAVAPDLESVKRKTSEILKKWQVPLWSKGEPPERQVSLHRDQEWETTAYSSAMGQTDQLRMLMNERTEAVYIPGGLTEALFAPFQHTRHPFAWILEDPTKLFLPWQTMLKWYRAGGSFYVLNRSDCVALSVSPFSPKRIENADHWLYGIKEIAGDLPVLDAKRERIL